ncbi:MAG: tol-pal system-associated acyl-CoA thioesterase [Mariprofundales bacterium]
MEKSWPIRIYYEDTDHGGIVYHANYLRYMERARTEFLRSAGIELDAIQQQWGILFAVTKLTIDYRASAHFNDLLEVISSIEKPRGARLHYRQHIVQQSSGELITSATVALACIDNNGKPRRIPAALNTSLCALAQQGESNSK